jgi:hypothetical protein
LAVEFKSDIRQIKKVVDRKYNSSTLRSTTHN